MQFEWCEAWVDELQEPPYVLLLLKERDGGFVVHDPAEKRFPFRSPELEVAKTWLNEDGFYRLNNGRISIPRSD